MSDFIVGVRGFSGEGLGLLKKLYLEVLDLSSSLESSSVYRVSKSYKNSKTIHDLRSMTSFEGLVAAFRGKTDLTALKLVDELRQIEEHFNSESLHRSASLTLFCFDQETIMTARLTVPFPDLHQQPDELVPASEVWADYVHPVLQKSLEELSRNYSAENWGEFVAQGIELKES